MTIITDLSLQARFGESLDSEAFPGSSQAQLSLDGINPGRPLR